MYSKKINPQVIYSRAALRLWGQTSVSSKFSSRSSPSSIGSLISPLVPTSYSPVEFFVGQWIFLSHPKNTCKDVHADSHSCRCHWLQSRSWVVSALAQSTLCRWSRRQEGWHSHSLMSLKTWTQLEEKRKSVVDCCWHSKKPSRISVCACTSLERARAACAAVFAGAGGDVRAAEGAVLFSWTRWLLWAGRLVWERAAAQQSGFLQDPKQGGGRHSVDARKVTDTEHTQHENVEEFF